MAPLARWRARRHRLLFWSLVTVAALVTAGGGVAAYGNYEATTSPAGTVKAYFDALSRDDASAALGFGSLPAGSSNLLTDRVLREQQRVAPIGGVHVEHTDRSGDRATVQVRYDLGFADAAQQITDEVPLVHRGHSWRLVSTARAVNLHLSAAGDRATLLGGVVPDALVLLFPGAVPVRFDTPYLQLNPDTRSVGLGGPGLTSVDVQASAAGRAAMKAALRAALPGCLKAEPPSDPRCPLPSGAAVPGSVAATVVGDPAAGADITVLVGSGGILQVSADVTIEGSYRELDANDLAVARTGRFHLAVDAVSYARGPIQLQWQDLS